MCLFVDLVDIILNNSSKDDKGVTFIRNENDKKFVSYRRLYEKSLHILYNMQSFGLKPGDELIFQVDDNEILVYFLWACTLGGIIPVPVPMAHNDEQRMRLFKIWNILNKPHFLTSRELFRSLDSFVKENHMACFMHENASKMVFTEEMVHSGQSGTVHKPSQEDTAFILFSSGSTGDPKGVMVSHENAVANCIATNAALKTCSDDIALSWMSLTHAMGLMAVHIAGFLAGINQHIMSAQLFTVNPLLWLKEADTCKATMLYSPNFGYAYFLEFLNKNPIEKLDLSNVRFTINSAEPISSSLCDTFLCKMSKYGLKRETMLPVYGMTETSGPICCSPVGSKYISVNVDRESIVVGQTVREQGGDNAKNSIFVDQGYPIDCFRVRVCDDGGHILDDYRVGHIQVSGKSVIKGYYNNRKATHDAFTGDGWLKTGDIGFLRNGRLVITGRAKDVIFVNGQNIYPHDIERVVERLEKVGLGKAVACGLYNDELKKDEIILFIEYKKGVKDFIPLIQCIKEQVARQTGLGIAKVLPVDRIPKVGIGKIQRYKLGRAYQEGEFSSVENEIEGWMRQKREIAQLGTETPNDSIVRTLEQIWRTVLKVEHVSVNENFFVLGGDSLKASILLMEISKQMDVEIPLRDIFKNATVRDQMEYILHAEKKKYSHIAPVEESLYYPVSSAQKRMYLINRMEGASVTYNIPMVFTVEGVFSGRRLEYTIKALVDRHESFRTSFHTVDGEIVQKVHPEAVCQVDYRECGEDEAKNIVKESVRPFDLEKAPLLRVSLLKIAKDRHILMIDMHHIIADGTSSGLFTRELASLYSGEELPEPTNHYKDFAEWQNNLFKSGGIRKQEEYWTNLFSGEIPILNMLLDYPRPSMQSFEGDSITFAIDSELTSRIKELSTGLGTTLYMTLLGAYSILLSKYSGQDDIVVGTAIAGRSRPDLEGIIGMFVNTIAMRNYPQSSKTIEQFLQEVKENSLKAYENQDYPFEELVQKLKAKRDSSRNPIFDTMFVLQNEDLGGIKIPGVKFLPYGYKSNISKFDLTLNMEETGGRITVNLEYCTRLFKKETMERLAGHYINILKEVAGKPHARISEVNMLSEEEKRRILYEFNATRTEYPEDKTIQELFEEQVAKFPDKIAVAYEDRQLTYEELDRKSTHLARILRGIRIGPDSVVGIMTEKSLEMIIGILGILKAGGAYLPIDPDYPRDRIRYMLEDSGAGIVLTQQELQAKIKLENEMIFLDDENLYKTDIPAVKNINTPRDLAYIIYTSGSTGKPKGVMIEHRSVVRLVKNNGYIDFNPNDRILQTGTIVFDAFTFEVWGVLLNGLVLQLVHKDVILDAEKLRAAITKYKITTLWLTSPLFSQLSLEDPAMFKELKNLLVGGDVLSPSHISNVRKKCEDINIINGYGPTENTTFSTCFRIDKNYDSNIPIGKPINNSTAYIMDQQRNLVPIGVVGELWVGGDGVARGYLNNPRLTDEKFISDPFISEERIYKTGDLARWLPDGNIEFFGRMDREVKIRGYRIDLGEIETQLLNHLDVKEAVVIDRGESSCSKYLCAYLVAYRELKAVELREYLSVQLPDYMIPAYFMQIEKIPLTPNGKVDRKALPEPQDTISTGTEYATPRNEAEEKLALVWQEVLGGQKIGINDNFFELGGDSIKAIQLVAKAKEIGIHISVSAILINKTISKLAEKVDYTQLKDAISQEEVQGEVLLTPIQKWFFENYKDYYPHYWNQINMFNLQEDTDIELLEAVLKKTIEHHDALRMGIRWNSETVVQFNRGIDEVTFTLGRIDLSQYTYEAQKERIKEISEKMQDSLNLEGDMLIKACVFDLGVNGKRLLMIIHHLIVDIVSWKILLEDMEKLYHSNLKSSLPPKTTSFKEWSHKLYNYGKTEYMDISYWESIASAKITSLFAPDIKENLLKDHRILAIAMDKEETRKILTGPYRRYGAQINDILLSALVMSITEAAQTDKILLNLEGYGREEIIKDVDLSRTVGWFTAIYPVYLERQENVEKTIEDVKEKLRKIPNRGINYGISRYINNSEKLKALTPQLSFNYMGQFDNGVKGDTRTLLSSCTESAGRAVHVQNQYHILMDINGMVKDGKLQFTVSYNVKYIDVGLVEKFCAGFKEYLAKIAEDCTCTPESISKIPNYRWFYENTPGKKELKVELQNDITTYLHHSLPLSIILADEKMRPWYYEHFTNLFSIRHSNDYLELDFLESWVPYRSLMDEVCIGYDWIEKIGDVVEFLEKRIDSGYYSILCMDEYYLPEKANYRKEHYVHPSLIYGYDSSQRKFMAIGFNSQHLFSKMTFDYELLAIAFEQSKVYYRESAPWAERGAIQLLLPIEFDDVYPYNAHIFLNELYNYIFSRGDRWKVYSMQHYQHQVKFGFSVYEEFVDSLEDLLQDKVMVDYRAAHLLYEHKKSIYRNIKYIMDCYQITGRLEELLEKYLKIVEQFNGIRTKFLELQYKELYEYTMSGENLKNMPVIKQIIESVNSNKEEERELLICIYHQLEGVLEKG